MCCVINSTGDINSLSTHRLGWESFEHFSASRQSETIKRNRAKRSSLSRVSAINLQFENKRTKRIHIQIKFHCLYPQKGMKIFVYIYKIIPIACLKLKHVSRNNVIIYYLNLSLTFIRRNEIRRKIR